MAYVDKHKSILSFLMEDEFDQPDAQDILTTRHDKKVDQFLGSLPLGYEIISFKSQSMQAAEVDGYVYGGGLASFIFYREFYGD